MFIPRVLRRLFGRMVRFMTAADDSRLYGLDHAILNIDIPPRHMWMNMGYWEHTDSFPDACEALLRQVLITAGLEDDITSSAGTNSTSELGDDIKKAQRESEQHGAIRLIDVGIGCGDQSLYLTRKLTRLSGNSEMEHAPHESNEGIEAISQKSEGRPLLGSYVGITITPSQAEFARERLLKPTTFGESQSSSSRTPDIKIFAADAADPGSWGHELNQAVLSNTAVDMEGDKKYTPDHTETRATTKPERQTWLLALDTLYHFRPSRKPMLNYACLDMRASFMAFDLLLSADASFWNRLVLRALCLVMGAPFSNFLDRKGYEDMLVDVGYERHMIEIRDISEHVFSGIAGYSRKRDAELRRYGMRIGKFKWAAKVFDWWARSGVVRGVVVVARLPEKPKED